MRRSRNYDRVGAAAGAFSVLGIMVGGVMEMGGSSGATDGPGILANFQRPGLSAQRRRPWRCAMAKWLTSPGDPMTDVIDRLVVAVNAHDLDAVAGLFHEDYRSEQPAHPSRAFVGRAQMRANWAAMFAGIPDFRAEICRSVQDGDTVWSEWRWSGTRTDGQTFEVRGVTIFDIADDQIAAGRLYMEDVEHDVGGIEHAVEALSGRRPRRNGQ